MVLSLRLHVLQHGFQLTRLSDCGMPPTMIHLIPEVNRVFSAGGLFLSYKSWGAAPGSPENAPFALPAMFLLGNAFARRRSFLLIQSLTSLRNILQIVKKNELLRKMS